MSTAELKVKLIKEITDSDNEELLKDVFRLIELERDDSIPYPFTEKQLSIIAESESQVDSGEFLTNEEANKEIDKWLEK
jgi:hypothetical protein